MPEKRPKKPKTFAHDSAFRLSRRSKFPSNPPITPIKLKSSEVIPDWQLSNGNEEEDKVVKSSDKLSSSSPYVSFKMRSTVSAGGLVFNPSLNLSTTSSSSPDKTLPNHLQDTPDEVD